MTRELLMRAGTVDVSPATPGALAGYAARGDSVSVGVNDPLEASLLVLDDTRHRVGWLAIDAVAVPAALAERLKDAVRTGMRDGAIDVVVSASHTHSAPLGWVGSIHPGHPGAVDPDAVDDLVARVTALAAGMADSPAEAVDASWAEYSADGLGTNRLDPRGPHDNRVGVLALRSSVTGAIRAVLWDAATHPTVFGPNNLLISADWPGAARRLLRAALQAMNVSEGLSDATPCVLFLQGAAGDISTRFTRRGDGVSEVARLGAIAAAATINALARDAVPLAPVIRHASRVLTMPRRSLPSIESAERDLERAVDERRRLDSLSRLDPRVRLAQSRIEGARVQRELVRADPAETIAFAISATAVGDAAWMHTPAELFASVGERIRDSSPFSVTRVIGYTDDYVGYLADEAALAAQSYEAMSTLLPPDAEARVSAAAHQVLEEIR